MALRTRLRASGYRLDPVRLRGALRLELFICARRPVVATTMPGWDLRLELLIHVGDDGTADEVEPPSATGRR